MSLMRKKSHRSPTSLLQIKRRISSGCRFEILTDHMGFNELDGKMLDYTPRFSVVCDWSIRTITLLSCLCRCKTRITTVDKNSSVLNLKVYGENSEADIKVEAPILRINLHLPGNQWQNTVHCKNRELITVQSGHYLN